MAHPKASRTRVKNTTVDERPSSVVLNRSVCAQRGCGRLIPSTWGERPFCRNRQCSVKQRENPLFWAYQEARLLRERATSRRCSANYYRESRERLAAWTRTLEFVARERIEAERSLIDDLRSKGDELSLLIRQQEADARGRGTTVQGQVSLDRPFGEHDYTLLESMRTEGYVSPRRLNEGDIDDPTANLAIRSVLGHVCDPDCILCSPASVHKATSGDQEDA